MRDGTANTVMPALVAGLHVFLVNRSKKQDVDARDKLGHDEGENAGYRLLSRLSAAREVTLPLQGRDQS